jgi:hypothetical protein
MTNRTSATTFLLLLACGSVGWLAGRGGFCPTCLADPFNKPAKTLPISHETATAHEVTDEEVQRRVQQLIDAEVFTEFNVQHMAAEAENSAASEPPLRLDLWMTLFTASPTTLDEPTPPQPRVDTLEFRPTDAKKGEFEAFQRRPW